jgi:hypothetical protein
MSVKGICQQLRALHRYNRLSFVVQAHESSLAAPVHYNQKALDAQISMRVQGIPPRGVESRPR